MTEELVEKVARALCAAQGGKWDAAHFGETLAGEAPDEMRAGYLDDARAVIPVVLEAAAQVAEDVGERVYGITPEEAGFLDGCNAAARSIRNLGSI